MYNGIGLATARGSGTNGFVQRNLCAVRKHKDKVDYKSEEQLKKLDQMLIKQPNQEIMNHDRKRKVELKCMEMQELMEEQGYSAEDIELKVSVFRKMLMEKEGVSESGIDKDEMGRPIARETHQLAQANQEKNARLRDAFGLGDYVDGSAFDPARNAKLQQAKALAMAQKKYQCVEESSESEEEQPSPPAKRKKKKSRKKHKEENGGESSSPERPDKKKKKSKKHKHDRSDSKKHKKSKKSKSRVEEKKSKKRKGLDVSSSSSESDVDSVSWSASSPDSEGSCPERSSRIRKKPSTGQSSEVAKVTQKSVPASPPRRKPTGRASSPSPRPTKENGMPKSKTSNGYQRNGKLPVSPLASHKRSRSSSSSPDGRRRYSSPKSRDKATESLRNKRSFDKYDKRRKSRSPSHSRRLSHNKSRRSSRSPTSSRSRSSSYSRSRSSSRKRSYSRSASRGRRRSRSRSSNPRLRGSRSPSIRRRKGSPSHLDKRRITSARKRPVPYYRPTPPSDSSDDSYRSGRSGRSGRSRGHYRSRSPVYHRHRYRRSSSLTSLDSH